MRGYLGESNSTSYSPVYMKAKLQEYYGNRVVISECKGRSSIVALTSSAHDILRIPFIYTEFDTCRGEDRDNEFCSCLQ